MTDQENSNETIGQNAGLGMSGGGKVVPMQNDPTAATRKDTWE